MNDKICIGCGAKLQDENISLEGYTTNIENDICSRCFRMKNYGEYQIVTKSNDEYIEILKEVDKTKDLVLYIVDALNFGEDVAGIRKYISNNMILVVNKRDVLPKSVKDSKLISYLNNLDLDFKDIVVISCQKNYNIDTLMGMIKKYKSSKNVYVVGNTNVGKSSLINKLIKNYSEYEGELTISPMPSTTLNKISIKLSDDLTIIDTPGLVNRGNIINYVDNSLLKKINPKKEIKPKTYQIKTGQCLVIGDLFRIDYVEGGKNSFTLYVSNDLKVKRYNMNKCTLLKDHPKTTYDVGYHKDLVIDGLGFIKIVVAAKVDVYADINVNVFERDSVI
jgi:ribosome biogenesis GTPase YqeH